MRALVTGANGHIGANLVRALVEGGHEVVAFVRDGSDLRGLEGVEVTIARGDVCDAEPVLRAIDGCEVVFHAAAPYRLWARDPDEIVRPAVIGTENVLGAARTHGVRRVVVTSSCNAVGFTNDPSKPRDESMWNDDATSPYVRAKNAQERRTWALAEELDLDVVTILPTAVLGRLDFRKTPTTAPMVDALSGRGPVPFPMNLVDVRDVARAHVLAAEGGKRGTRYLVGGDNVDVPELASIIEHLTGKRPPEGLPPLWLLRVVASVAELGARFSGKPPFLTRALLEESRGRAPVFDCSRARRDLGLAPRSADEVVRETLAWAREMGWLPDGQKVAA
ncbi:MAG: NAD-dependent epimerase/dehydratase family protein [Labilithrix sp.]